MTSAALSASIGNIVVTFQPDSTSEKELSRWEKVMYARNVEKSLGGAMVRLASRERKVKEGKQNKNNL